MIDKLLQNSIIKLTSEEAIFYFRNQSPLVGAGETNRFLGCPPNEGFFILEEKMNEKEHHRKYMIAYYRKKPWLVTHTSAKSRCNNPNNNSYKRYGGKGIKMLMNPEDFKFLWFRDKAYLMKKPTIDRISSKGHYILKNCRYLEWEKNTKQGLEASLKMRHKNMWLKGRWSLCYDFCKNCGTNDIPYDGMGLCERCYGIKWRKAHSEYHKLWKRQWRVKKKKLKESLA